MKDYIKIILFVLLCTMFLTAIMHLVTFFIGDKFPLDMYWIMPVSIISICLIAWFVFDPLFNLIDKL